MKIMLENIFSRKSISDFFCNGVVLCCKKFGKLRNTHFLPSEFNNPVRAFVSLLLFLCCPSAILFAVPKVVVDPIQRMEIGRAMTHVFQECLKGGPSTVHWNVSFCVLSCGKRFIARHSGPHVVPTTISSCLVGSSPSGFGLAMLNFFGGNHFPHFASTRFNFPSAESLSANGFFGSAFTSAPPMDVSVNVRVAFTDNGDVSENLPPQIFDVRVKRCTTILVLDHCVFWLSSSGPCPTPVGRGCAPILHNRSTQARRIV